MSSSTASMRNQNPMHTAATTLPTHYDQAQDWAQKIGVGALYVFAAGCYIGTAIGNLAMAVMLLAFLVQLPGRARVLWREPLFLLAVTFLGYLLIRTLLAVQEFPHLESAQWKAAGGWATLWLFVVAGWFIGNKPRRAAILLALLCAGFLGESLIDLDWERASLVLIHSWYRLEAGTTPNGLGLLAAVGLFGMLRLGIPSARLTVGNHLKAIGAWTLVTAGTLLAGSLLLASHSRTAWFAMIFVVGASTLLSIRWDLRQSGAKRGRILTRLAVGTAGVILAAGVLWQIASVQKRVTETIQHEQAFFTAVADGAWDEIPTEGLGTRYYIFRFGVDRTLERPTFGWGPGISVTQEFASEDSPARLQQFADLHNAPLVIAARLGVAGVTFFALAGGILTVRLTRTARRTSNLPRRLCQFALGAMAIIAIASMMNFRWIHVEFGFLWVLVGGVGYSLTRPSQVPAPVQRPD